MYFCAMRPLVSGYKIWGRSAQTRRTRVESACAEGREKKVNGEEHAQQSCLVQRETQPFFHRGGNNSGPSSDALGYNLHCTWQCQTALDCSASLKLGGKGSVDPLISFAALKKEQAYLGFHYKVRTSIRLSTRFELSKQMEQRVILTGIGKFCFREFAETLSQYLNQQLTNQWKMGLSGGF